MAERAEEGEAEQRIRPHVETAKADADKRFRAVIASSEFVRVKTFFHSMLQLPEEESARSSAFDRAS
jgi:hypothetical protein